MRLFFMLSISALLLSCGEPVPDSYYGCNRAYDETSRITTSSSYGDMELRYNPISGKVLVKGRELIEQENTVSSSMDASVFFKFCVKGARANFRTPACPYYMECVSAVHQKKNGLSNNEGVYDFDTVAKILREDRISRGTLGASVARSSGRFKNVSNFANACDSTVSTDRANVLGATIYQHVPEVPDIDTATSLAETVMAAESHYGTCNCVLENYTGISQVMSIGYCTGDQYTRY